MPHFPPLLPQTSPLLGTGPFYLCCGPGTFVDPRGHRPKHLPSASRLSTTWPQFTFLASSCVSHVRPGLLSRSTGLFPLGMRPCAFLPWFLCSPQPPEARFLSYPCTGTCHLPGFGFFLFGLKYIPPAVLYFLLFSLNQLTFGFK